MLASAILLLYPPQLPFLGLSGFGVTIAGAVCVVAVYLMRSRSRAAFASSAVKQ
jgi:CHASE1-domain containing sensor protein